MAQLFEAMNMIQFVRHCLTVTGVFESICLHCGRRVAFSPDMRVLDIAEESHVCPEEKIRAATG